MKLCPGKALKIAAIRSIEICQRDGRSKPPGPCHLLGSVNGSRILLTCSCGAASTWRCGLGQRVPLFSSTFSTVATAEDIAAVQMLNCEMLWLPCTKNSAVDQFTPDEYQEEEMARSAFMVVALAYSAVLKWRNPLAVAEGVYQAVLELLSED